MKYTLIDTFTFKYMSLCFKNTFSVGLTLCLLFSDIEKISGRSRRGRSEPDIEALLIKFRNLGGVPFSGNESIIQTQAWMSSVKRIFERIRLRDDQKRLLASWALKDEALFW